MNDRERERLARRLLQFYETEQRQRAGHQHTLSIVIALSVAALATVIWLCKA